MRVACGSAATSLVALHCEFALEMEGRKLLVDIRHLGFEKTGRIEKGRDEVTSDNNAGVLLWHK